MKAKISRRHVLPSAAVQALSAAHKPSDALLEQLSSAERHAFIAWLTTQPTTTPGVAATLQYASRRPYASPASTH